MNPSIDPYFQVGSSQFQPAFICGEQDIRQHRQCALSGNGMAYCGETTLQIFLHTYELHRRSSKRQPQSRHTNAAPDPGEAHYSISRQAVTATAAILSSVHRPAPGRL
jgi:hypothetical protein